MPPDAEAMRNRPVSAAGEVQAQSRQDQETLPEDSLGGVQPPPPPPKPRAEPTARIEFPKKSGRATTMSLPASKPAGSGHSRLVWVLLGIAVVIVVGMGVFGMIVYHRRSKELKAKKLEQRLRVWRMRRELKRKATRLPAGECAEGMIWISTSSSNGKGGDEPGFCIDKYEYPNKKSVHPESIADVSEAKKACAKLGKRLCTKAEWQRACVGPKNLRFPYGPKYDPSKCATKPAGGESPPVQASGSWPDCRSAEGVLDMSGNVAEWVSGGALMGGSGALTGRDTSCTAEGGGGGPAYYGARCCTSPATGE